MGRKGPVRGPAGRSHTHIPCPRPARTTSSHAHTSTTRARTHARARTHTHTHAHTHKHTQTHTHTHTHTHTDPAIYRCDAAAASTGEQGPRHSGEARECHDDERRLIGWRAVCTAPRRSRTTQHMQQHYTCTKRIRPSAELASVSFHSPGPGSPSGLAARWPRGGRWPAGSGSTKTAQQLV